MTSRPRTLLPLLPVLAAAFLLSFYRVVSLDIFWHVKAGQVILETGRLLTTNTFSATYPDHPWPNPEWLFQVVVAALHDWGGWPAITLFKVGLVLLLAPVLYAAVLAAGGSRAAAASLAIFSLSALRFRFLIRPHLISYLFFALTVLVTQRHLRREDRLVWVLPPLFALWSNIHPELFIGLLYLGAVLAGGYLDGKRPRSLLLAALCCVPATLLNPETYHVLAFPFLHVFLGPVVEVTEYVFSSFDKAPLFWVFLAVLGAVLLHQRRERSWVEIVPLAGLALFGALWLRSTPYIFLAGAPVLASRLRRFREVRTLRYADLIPALAAAAALTWAAGFERLQEYRWGWGLMESNYPVAAASFLAKGPIPGGLFNNYAYGSYLIYRLYPAMGVFQDGRLQAYPREFISRLNARLSPDELPAVLGEYGVNTALIMRPEIKLFDTRLWALVFWDERWAVVVRRSRMAPHLLEKIEYRVFLPDTEVAVVRDRKALGRLAAEMERNQRARLARSSVVDNNLGTVYRRLGRGADAEFAFRKALDMEPHYAPAWANLGILYFGAGKKDQAIPMLERAVREDPSLAVARANLGILYFEVGKRDRAVAMLERAVREDPSLAAAASLLKKIQEQRGEE